MVRTAEEAGTNWGGEYRYRSARLLRPRSIEELRAVVRTEESIHALGTRHSFNDVADTAGTLVSLTDLPHSVEIDASRGTAWVSGGMTYSAAAVALEAEGWALHDLASLPHISVAGAIATGTHGSGSQSLSAAVVGLELIDADGQVRQIGQDHPGFRGAVVAIGALGIVTRVELRIEPSYAVAQVAFDDVSFDAVTADLDGVFAAGDSVSIFTDWRGDRVQQIWVKSRSTRALPSSMLDGTEAREQRHPVRGRSGESCTVQGRVVGPWLERLPHFRMGFTPSSGREIQSEYLVPWEAAREAVDRMRELGELLAPVLQVSELRAVRADELWLSGAHLTDVVGFHFTWHPDADAVARVLPSVEDRLRPLGARPHWGKVHDFDAAQISAAFPRAHDFARLAATQDPTGKFRNAAFGRWFEQEEASS